MPDVEPHFDRLDPLDALRLAQFIIEKAEKTCRTSRRIRARSRELAEQSRQWMERNSARLARHSPGNPKPQGL